MADAAGRGSTVPKHLGLILDGNRRWARSLGLPLVEGHRRGYQTFRIIALEAAARGVHYISAYIFSTENWNRTQEEVDYLMDLIVWVATHEIEKFAQEGIKLVFLGSRLRLGKRVLKAMDLAEAKTAHNTRAVVALCLNYGGQAEIAEGVARLVADGVPANEVTPELIGQYLYHPEIPPVDFLIRASGEQRLSGYMLWRASYAELYFTDTLWPAFSVADLEAALAEFARRQRRFGK